MRHPAALLRLLRDGREHSGVRLAAELGVSRAAVQKQMQVLGTLGLAVEAVRGHGYRLPDAPLEPLSAPAIEAKLSPGVREALHRLEVVAITESTNSTLLERAPPPAGTLDVLFAEYQTGGRGRRGRAWVAPFGSGLLLSAALSYPDSRTDLSAITLAVGVALLRALAAVGVAHGALKWPNDIEVDGAKLAGILCELKVEAGGPAHIVIGVGINVALPAATIAGLAAAGRRVTDLRTVRGGLDDELRARLAARVLEELALATATFRDRGFAAFHADWSAADALRDREVLVDAAGTVRAGIARGVALDGALLVERDGVLGRVESGEVSVREVL